MVASVGSAGEVMHGEGPEETEQANQENHLSPGPHPGSLVSSHRPQT